MISGLETLSKLDSALGTVRTAVNKVDAEFNHVSEALHSNRRNQAHVLGRLAEIRLDELSAGRLQGDLSSADDRAMNYLLQRQEAINALEDEINRDTTTLQQVEAERDPAVAQRDAAAQAVIDCEHRVQEGLEQNETFQAMLVDARNHDSIAFEAEAKADTAVADRTEKGAPFERDPLFMYLWGRRYGTADYNASVLTRYLDNWVAKLCDYESYRVNYWTLLEIPKRLVSHAETARSRSDQALEELADYERTIAEDAGLPALQAKLETEQADIDVVDERIDNAEELINGKLEQRTQYAQAKDRYMEQSLQVLTDALGGQSLIQLNDAAHQTQNERDNQLVRELADLREQQDDLQAELRDRRSLHKTKLSRLKELEQVRRRFKNRRFDDVRSGFGNENLLGSVLGEFIGGLVSGVDLWRTIERHQRHRDVGAWPDFGSGGLGGSINDGFSGRRRTGRSRNQSSPWHHPRGRGPSGGGFRLPRSGGGSSRGGGFRTGGGF